MTPWIRYVLAFLVFCHGFVYLRIGPTLPGPIKGWKGTSKLLGAGVTGDRLIAVVRVLHVLAGVAILACAVSIAFFPAWWRASAIVGGIIGLVAFALFWDGQTGLLLEEGAIGVVASVVLLVCALTVR